MSYDIRMCKLVSGETIVGKYDKDQKQIKDPAILQVIPSQQTVQMMLVPFGYPFESEFAGHIDETHVIYMYAKCPEDLKDKYLEAVSNLTLSSGGIDLDKAASASGLLRGK